MFEKYKTQIGKDFNYEIFKHISNELRKQF